MLRHPLASCLLLFGPLIACGDAADSTDLDDPQVAEGPDDAAAASLANGLGGGNARILRAPGGGRFCLDAHKVRDARTGKGTIAGPVQLWSCAVGEGSGFNQRWSNAADGLFFAADDHGRRACLVVSSYRDGVVRATYGCNAGDIHQRWVYDAAKKQVRMRNVVFVQGKKRLPICLAFPRDKRNGTAVGIKACSDDPNDVTQALVPEG